MTSESASSVGLPRSRKAPKDLEKFHIRTRDREPDAVYELVWIPVSLLLATGVFRARAIDVNNVPARGPVILAANHASFMDPFFVGAFIGRLTHFMAKAPLFRGPLRFIHLHGGVFPVRQGERDEDAFETAHAVLRRGGCVTIFPEGGISRTGELAERGGRGVGRLALESGAPVVPVAILDSHRVRDWKRLRLARSTVRYGAPLRWEHSPQPDHLEQRAAADEVWTAIRELHASLAARGHREVRRQGPASRARWPRRRP